MELKRTRISRPIRCLIAAVSLSLGLFAQTVTLTPSPTSLSFNYQAGAAIPAPLTLSVRASTGTPNYSASITGTNTLWLTATPDTGKTPANLSVRANPTGMSVGTYTATIVVTAGGGTANVPVTLVVSQPLPALTLSTNSLTFAAPPNVPTAQTVKLTTSGGPVTFTAAASGSAWLTVSPASGVVLPGAQLSLTISVDATSLTPQTAAYVGKVTVVAAGVPTANKTQNITVSLTVNSATPTITSLWPSSTQVNAPATTVTIRGTGFYTGSVAKISGTTTSLTTTVLSSTALLAVIPAAQLTTAQTLNLIVSNPGAGGDSAVSPFTVSATPVVQATVNVASYGGVSVCPGELVTLFGANIGPASPATMSDVDGDGYVDTTLNNVSVTIDGIDAPLLYVSTNQISAQVPYTVTTGTAKAIAVVNGTTTATGTVDITATAPGIFTLDGSGVGQAAALNYNATTGIYTVNAANNPAKLGDTIVLYVTGEGDYVTTPTQHTGWLVQTSTTPLPQVSPLPAVTIGGATATVAYAGPVPGSILGLLQLNVVVPAGSTTGTAIAVTVSIGGTAAQSGVTISVHP